MTMTTAVQRGQIVDVDLDGAKGAEKKNDPTAGSRPCLVVQNDVGNLYSDLTIVVPLTDADQFKRLPVQVLVEASDIKMPNSKRSVIECGHIYTIDGDARILGFRGTVGDDVMRLVDDALRVSIDLRSS